MKLLNLKGKPMLQMRNKTFIRNTLIIKILILNYIENCEMKSCGNVKIRGLQIVQRSKEVYELFPR